MYSKYKKTDGDDYYESDPVGYHVEGMGWKLWVPIIFIFVFLIALTVMTAIQLNSNVSKVSNQDLKEEIREQCGFHHESDSSDGGKSKHKGGGDKCETQFGSYMTARFDSLFHSLKNPASQERDWASEWQECGKSELRHSFDQRMNYLGEWKKQWPVKEEWNIKDLKEYMSDKLDWLGERISLVSVQNENKNENNNDVDIVIENDNKMEVDLKNTVNTAVLQLAIQLNGILDQLSELEDYLGMSQQKVSADDRNLREVIGDGFEEVEELLQQQQLKGDGDESEEEPDIVPVEKRQTQHWLSSGADTDNSKFSRDIQQLQTLVVHDLNKRWGYSMRGSVGSSTTPTTDGNLVFSTDYGGDVFALEHSNGRLVWKRSLNDILGVNERRQGLIVSRSSPTLVPDCGEEGESCLLLGAPGDRGASGYPQQGGTMYTGPVHVVALDAATGETLWQSPALETHPWSQLTASLSVEEGKVFGGITSMETMAPLIDSTYPCCSFRGSAFALDLITGSLLWQTYTIPPQSHRNTLTKKLAYAGAGIKGSNPPIDLYHRLVFFATSQFSMIPNSVSACLTQKSGGDKCLEKDMYPAALLALDMDSGRVVYSHVTHGAAAWTGVCAEKPSDPNCPQPVGQDHTFSQSPVLHAVGEEQRILALQSSGEVWSLRAADGALRWRQQLPPGGSWGCAYDRDQEGFVCAVTGAPRVSSELPQPVTYELADGTIVCDASWWFLDARTGEVRWQTASPYSRPAKDCPPSLFEVDGSSTARVGKCCHVEKWNNPLASAQFASSYGPPAIGGGVVYVTEMTGHVYALDAASGDCLHTVKCEAGAIYGGVSLSRGKQDGLELLTVSCGYGRLQWERQAGCGDRPCSLIAFGL